MKYLLGILLFFVSIGVGVALSNRYKNEVQFLRDYKAFLAYLRGEIVVFKKKMNDSIKQYCVEKDGIFIDFLRQYPNNKAKNKVENSVLNFLEKMKNVDEQRSTEYLKLACETCEKDLTDREIKNKTDGNLALKLSPLVGIAFFLLVL